MLSFLSAKSWGMIFNDTSEEKAEAFMDKKCFWLWVSGKAYQN